MRGSELTIIIDSREQNPLKFQEVSGVSVVCEGLDVGDYAYKIGDVVGPIRIERKSIPDLFGSFSSGYEAEKAKIIKARQLGYKYILAIEGTAFDVREGHQYRRDGEVVAFKKDGLSQIRQLMTSYAKGYFDIWWSKSRHELAFMIQEYFRAVVKLNEGE